MATWTKTWHFLLLLACFGPLLPIQATTAAPLPPTPIQAAPIPVPGFPEPLIAIGPVSAEDARALEDFLARQPSRTAPDLAAFQPFLAAHPHSPYRLAMLTDLGLTAYRQGAFSKAIAFLESAFQEGRTSQPQTFTQKLLIDRAAGELLRMHARLGHMARLETLLGELGSVPLAGIGAEYAQGAREGLWHMRHDPGVAEHGGVGCGYNPYPVSQILCISNPMIGVYGSTSHFTMLSVMFMAVLFISCDAIMRNFLE
jgi:hypothetical protein